MLWILKGCTHEKLYLATCTYSGRRLQIVKTGRLNLIFCKNEIVIILRMGGVQCMQYVWLVFFDNTDSARL